MVFEYYTSGRINTEPYDQNRSAKSRGTKMEMGSKGRWRPCHERTLRRPRMDWQTECLQSSGLLLVLLEAYYSSTHKKRDLKPKAPSIHRPGCMRPAPFDLWSPIPSRWSPRGGGGWVFGLIGALLLLAPALPARCLSVVLYFAACLCDSIILGVYVQVRSSAFDKIPHCCCGLS